MRPLLKFIRVCSQHDAAPEVKPAVNAYRDLGTLGKGGWGRKSRLIDWYIQTNIGRTIIFFNRPYCFHVLVRN